MERTSYAQPRVVTIGGGTGHYTLLSGLKEYPVHITAIVSMADDGGSSGVLRDELGVLPPGDVRQCLAALSEESEVMRDLFNYRFADGSLRGHSFGNLFLAALEKVAGGFAAGVQEASRLLAVHGEVIPVSEGDMRLLITLKNGTKLSGEKFLDASEEVNTIGVKSVSLVNPVQAHKDALQRIREADVVVLGPGDLYGSTLPPLLVPEISHAVRDTHATVVYVANLTNKKGQTEGFSADDYVRVLRQYIGAHVIDVVICNTELPPPHLRERYEQQEGKNTLVACMGDDIQRGYRIIREQLLSEDMVMLNPRDALQQTRSFIRHDSHALARSIMRVVSERE